MYGSESVYIFGYSGHSYVIIESMMALGMNVKGYFDIKPNELNPYHLHYMGSDRELDVKELVGNTLVFPTVGDNSVRERIVRNFDNWGLRQFVLKDATASVSPSATVNVSTYIGKGVSVNALSRIGKGGIINTGVIVEHECKVNDYVHLAPASVLCGNVSIGESTMVGANSVIKQGVSIANNCVIGAGTVVLNDINGSGQIWVGNPARQI